MSSSEWLEQFAVALAAEHNYCALPKRSRKQMPEIEEKGTQLERFRVECSELRARQHRAGPLSISSGGGIHNGQAILPATEWLIDNLPVIEEHLREIGEDLPRSNYDELPKIIEGELAGFPRIYAVAVSLTTHVSYSLNADTLKRFMLAYQDTTPLSLGELGKLAITLRLILLENLQRNATCIITQPGESEEYVGFANRLPGITMVRSEYITSWRAEMENILVSLRLLSTFNWPAFLESISPVDLAFREDPTGVYPLMEFATRDRYRRVVERIARYTNVAERDVARCAVELALESDSSHPDDEYLAHVGYYLIDGGRTELEKRVGYRPSWRERFSRAVRRNPSAFCLGSLALLTAFILALFVLYASLVGVPALMLSWLLMLLLIPASEVALRIVDAVFTLEPSLIPKMDFTSGTPEELQTMIVVPAIFSSEAAIHELLESIEAHYLANQDEHIFFALLGDWSDAAQEKMPNDGALLEIALNGIKELNTRHRHGSRDRFYLFHRRRKWNQGEGKWMGWERKRGKLCEFNQLLRGKHGTSYIVCTAEQAFLAHIRYIITLDSDTHLPRDTARRLIGTISHPLNRPKVDASTGRVRRGYIIIQPQIINLLPCAQRSRIPRILSNYISVNLDVKHIPDTYQNVFGEGIYIGKGLYDVDAFESVMKDRVPENSLLSHDLYECLFARTVVVTDIEVFETGNLFYESRMRMLHRWIRGDWQLLPWLMPYVRNANGKSVRNVLPTIARWKILDNLRWSLLPVTILLWLAAAWTVLPGSPSLWTLLVLTVLAVIAYFRGVKMGVLTLRDKIPGVGLWGSIKCAAKIGIAHFLLSFREALFLVVFLTYQSYFRADGILRTLYRVLISRKHLLEWDTTAQTQKDSRHDLGAFFSFMWPALMIALVIGVLIFSSNPAAFIPAAPFLFSWLVTPLAAYWINHQGIERDKMSELLVEEAIRFYGRRVWRDLESIIDKDHHILPLNFHQKDPGSMIVAHTLSTNLLRLPLWAVTAHDLGCIGTIELADSLEHAFERIVKRQNLYSHHLNPHVTQELKLHTPRHILEFENGNLAYYLSTFKQGCVEIVNRPLFGERVLNGLNDTISLLKEEVARAERAQVTKRTVIHPQLHEEIDACAAFLSAQALAEGRQTLTAWRKLVDSLAQHAAIVNQRLTVFSQGSGADNEEIRSWADSLVHQVRELDRDFRMLAPWTSVCTTHLEAIIYQSDASALEAWSHITDTLDRMPSVSHFPATSNAILHELVALRSKICGRALATGLDCTAGLIEFDALVSAIEEALEFSKNILLRYTRVAQQSEAIMKVMDVGSLFDEERRMLLVNSHVSSASWARSQLIV